MQKLIDTLWLTINSNVDWVIVILVIAAGFAQKKLLKDVNLRTVNKTLLLSFAFTVVYLLLIGDLTNKASLAKYFFSFVVATSFYEIFLEPWTKAGFQFLIDKFKGPLIFIISCSLLLLSCKEKRVARINPIQAIDVKYEPREQHLMEIVQSLKDSIKTLQTKLQTASNATTTVKEKAKKTIAARAEAKSVLDTVRSTVLCDELENDFTQFVMATEQEDSIQSEIISFQDSVIATQSDQLVLASEKQQETVNAFNQEAAAHTATKKQLKKSGRKLAVSKFLKKAGVVVAVAAAIIFVK